MKHLFSNLSIKLVLAGMLLAATAIFGFENKQTIYAFFQSPKPNQQESTDRSKTGEKENLASNITDDANSEITLCDQLASDADDPESVATGVSDEMLKPKEIIEACLKAINESGDNVAPRLNFQLARGYLANGDLDNAMEQLSISSGEGHGASFSYLADIYLNGVQNIKADPELAMELYEKATSLGYEPATKVLEELKAAELAQVQETEENAESSTGAAQRRVTDREILEKKRQEEESARREAKQQAEGSNKQSNLTLKNPEIVNNIQSGNFDAVPGGEFWVKNYLVEMASTISEECQGQYFSQTQLENLRSIIALRAQDFTADGGAAVLARNLGSNLDMLSRFMKGEFADIAEEQMDIEEHNNKWMIQNVTEGVTDAYAYLSVNKCGSPELSSFMSNIKPFIKNEGAPLVGVNDLFISCQRNSPDKSADAKRSCFCIASRLYYPQGSVSFTRAERKALATNYGPAMQKIIDKNKNVFSSCF